MKEIIKSTEAISENCGSQNIWTIIPSVLWFLAIIIILYCFNSEIKQLFSSLISRLKEGASIKLAWLEIGASSGLVAVAGDFSDNDSQVGVFEDNGTRKKERNDIYKRDHGVMLVHRIQRSKEDGQHYDALIYVIPHKSTSFAGVSSIEYFFGHYWGNKVFPSYDRSRGFPVIASAYAPFLCTAKVNFNDGTHTTLSRYIDFEMGSYTPART